MFIAGKMTGEAIKAKWKEITTWHYQIMKWQHALTSLPMPGAMADQDKRVLTKKMKRKREQNKKHSTNRNSHDKKLF